MPRTRAALCLECQKVDLASYFCGEMQVRKDADGHVGPGEGALFLKSLADAYISSKTCDFCRMILAALCKRFEPQSWETPKEYLERISVHVKDPGIYLYSFVYAEDTRAVGEDDEDDDEGGFIFYQCLQLGIGLSPPAVDTMPLIRLAARLALVSTSCESLGLQPDFYSRIVHPERANIQLAKTWLKECEFEHGPLCDTRSLGSNDVYTRPTPRDLRVIDVDRMCLVSLPQMERYITLSYRWGASRRHFITTSLNIASLEAENSLTRYLPQFPQTIQDAIDCVRELGERFFWVDALCIIQDDLAEKNCLIRQMDCIYESSLVTIIAAPPNEEHYPLPDGLPGYRAGTRLYAQDTAHVHGLDICTSFPSIEMALFDCAWADRAWTFQEELLSKRRLYFTASQLYFQCSCGVLCEDTVGEGKSPSAYIYGGSSMWNLAGLYATIGEGQAGFAQGLSRSKFKSSWHAIQYYHNLVERYTNRNMTDQEDALVALKGVLTVLGETMGTQFLFGLPEAYLDEALLWVTRRPRKRRQAVSNDLDSKYFPSWTWAAWETQSCYRGNSVGNIQPEANWFLVTRDGDIAQLSRSQSRASSWGLLEGRKHQDIAPDSGDPQLKLPKLKPRPQIKPEDAEVSSLACVSSIAIFQFLGDIVEEFNMDWPEQKNFIISDAHGRSVGAIWMGNTWLDTIKHQAQFEFMLLSRSKAVQYTPELDEGMFPNTEWSYVNVMLIKRVENFIERLGIGVIHENAWVTANAATMMLYLR